MRRFWKGNGKGAPFVKLAGDGNISAVGVGNCLGQAKTQTNTGLGAAWVASIESLKKMGKIFWVDTDSGVSDRNDNRLPVIRMDRNDYCPVRLGILDGIVH